MTLTDAQLADRIAAWFDPDGSDRLGLAVSGGGDSMAMLHLCAAYAERAGITLHAVTVDHGLRPEAGEEAAFVAETCAVLGVAHDTLHWQRPDDSGNLQDQARRGRYRLIADWAAARGIGTVALAHTLDDQAETVLMRLAREAGVDGLSGMRPRRTDQGVTWLRPLLTVGREDLRQYLTRNDLEWREDPSNTDKRYDRVKAREALACLAPLGITAKTLSGVALNMSRARQALDEQTLAAARSVCTVDRGDVVFDRPAIAAFPAETVRRLLQHSLIWMSGADYGPRGSALGAFMQAASAGKTATLHGCIALPVKGGFRLTREPQAVKETRADPDTLWDGRWRVTGAPKGAEIRALGERGLALCPDWRETGVPRTALLASPSVWMPEKLISEGEVLWYEGTLISAPLAGMGNGCRAELAQGDDSFYSLIISH